MKKKVIKIFVNFLELVMEFEVFYLYWIFGSLFVGDGIELFIRLVFYFDLDVLESVISVEFLVFGVVWVFEEIFVNFDEDFVVVV